MAEWLQERGWRIAARNFRCRMGEIDLIAENGSLLAEAKPFTTGCAITEIDTQRMESERVRNTTFLPRTEGYERVCFSLQGAPVELTRFVSRTPFVPGDEKARAERCELILEI